MKGNYITIQCTPTSIVLERDMLNMLEEFSPLLEGPTTVLMNPSCKNAVAMGCYVSHHLGATSSIARELGYVKWYPRDLERVERKIVTPSAVLVGIPQALEEMQRLMRRKIHYGGSAMMPEGLENYLG